ncbi:tail fiber protein [Fulvivirgaceae bacterium BMA12]|uniref:Tail fiber protein n=1 Tax=Agaribacillus aureus TaxID=3051825 RepID=A0ABT8LD49_9BACT|nr:tail fiber protein [Fulvivirgaceae bacterium BMA12]
MKKLIVGLLVGQGASLAQDIHVRNNGVSQTSVAIIRSDNASGDQLQSQTSDLDFQIWDSNTRLTIPQGRIGMVGHSTGSQSWEASGRMAFYTTNVAYPSPVLSERMRIDENGNIGIGTSSPQGKLQIQGVSGEQQQGQIHIVGNGLNGSGDAYVSFEEGAETNSKWSVGVKDNDNAFSISYGLTMDTSPKLIIKKVSGNVGIGTTTPDSKLTVMGNIHAREVKVTVNAGADFVFEDHYNLPSLELLEKYLRENKHLPEIAPAKEMEENGICLSAMNIKLLQKIEELTLYTINQEKKIKKLEMENETFRTLQEKFIKLQFRLEKLESEN